MILRKKSPQIVTNGPEIDEILTRSVKAVYPSRELFKTALSSGKRLKIYIGADATGTQLHIGHATNYMLVERLRRLGHEIIVLFGDFTAMIGDPTGKDAARVQLTEDQVDHNIKTWKEQISKVINLKDKKNQPKFVRNSSWLSKLTFTDVVKLASHFTVQQMIERDMFQKRLTEEKPIYLHEFFYPLMQGFDSVALDVDVEVGGNDQTFNMLAGRILQKEYNKKEKFVVATTLLVNPKTGKKLMNKSEGGYIALDDSAQDMFGKTMALPDEVIVDVFTDCTYVSLSEIEKIKADLARGVNPRDLKVRLAKEIISIYHGAPAAEAAEQDFINTFKKGELPDDTKEVVVMAGSPLIDILVTEAIVTSKSDFRRLVEGGAISEVGTNEGITDMAYKINRNISLRIGKKRFIKITTK